MIRPPEFGSLSAFVAELPAPEPIERLGLSLNAGCVAVNGHRFCPRLRSDLPSTGADRRRADCSFVVPATVLVAAHDMPAMEDTSVVDNRRSASL